MCSLYSQIRRLRLMAWALAGCLFAVGVPAAIAQMPGGGEPVPHLWQEKAIVGLGGRCLEVRSIAPGGTVRMADCQDVAGQRWSLRADGMITLSSQPGLCLDLRDGQDTRDVPVLLFQCHGGKSQTWHFGGGKFVTPGNNCLEVKGAHEVRGALVQIGRCGGGRHQQWTAR
jgi:hypothetical protein